jgi:multiple sugar transport system permease protein
MATRSRARTSAHGATLTDHLDDPVFQGSWNELSHFLVVTQSPEHKTIITGLASLTSGELGAGSQFPLKMGAALLTTIPVALILFAFQRHFVRGANEGSEKG